MTLQGGWVLFAFLASAAGPAAGGEGQGVEVLNASTYVRFCIGFRTPVYAAADGSIHVPTTGKENKPLAEVNYVPAPPTWIEPSFDDALWFRGHLPREISRIHDDPPGFVANSRHIICARAKFAVEEPGRVQGMRLSLSYIGGVAVYVNGKELTRKHLPAGELKPETLAERYIEDPYTDEDGKYYDETKKPERFASRWRALESVEIPSALLRKGVNVLAVENHRAPIHAAQMAAPRPPAGGMGYVRGRYAYIGLAPLRLTAAAGSPVTPNTDGPKGFQVWTCAPEAIVSPGDAMMNEDWRPVAISESYGDPCEKPRISIVAVCNGVFSGRLVVSSAEQAIRGLQVRASGLVQANGAGRIPASAVRIRCAMPAKPENSWCDPKRFDALFEAIPAEVPPASNPKVAMAPLWVTVRVPPDAAPGAYEGTISVTADGHQSVTVPLRLMVYGWRIPDPKDFRIYNLGSTSPETPAFYYKIPLWSDKHFEHIAKSLKLMAEVGSRTAFANLAVNYRTHGNTETMIRWVKQPDGGYKCDFTPFDRYLDVVAETLGKPFPLVLNMWNQVQVKEGKKFLSYDMAKCVSVLDPGTGKLSTLEQPFPDDPATVTFWKPVLDEVRKRLDKRGWFDTTGVGDCRYSGGPDPQTVSNLRKIWPDGKWYSQQHGIDSSFPSAEKGTRMPVVACTTVWNEGVLRPRAYKDLKPKPALISTGYARNRHHDASPLSLLTSLPEDMLLRGRNGLGPLGADYWPLTDEKGRRYNMGGESALGPQSSTKALLAPGPDGPVATERYEAFRKGVQIAEAILYLQELLNTNRLSGDLEARANAVLDDRSVFYINNFAYGRVDIWVYMPQVEPEAARLFALCAEAAKAAGPN